MRKKKHVRNNAIQRTQESIQGTMVKAIPRPSKTEATRRRPADQEPGYTINLIIKDFPSNSPRTLLKDMAPLTVFRGQLTPVRLCSEVRVMRASL